MQEVASDAIFRWLEEAKVVKSKSRWKTGTVLSDGWTWVRPEEGGDKEDCKMWEGLRVKPLSGGITNSLYKVELVKKTNDGKMLLPTISVALGNNVIPVPDAVVVRLFGPNTDIIINRKRVYELECYLEPYGLCKKIYAADEHSQIEEWIDGLAIDDGSKLYMDDSLRDAVAMEMAHLHSVNINSNKFGTESVIWKSIDRFLSECESRLKCSTDEDGCTPAIQRLRIVNFGQLRMMIKKIREECDEVVSPKVLGHGDILPGNVIRLGNGRVRLMDFEYAGVMERGFDIANHFCEYAGFGCDFKSHFPDTAKQLKFIGSYIKFSNTTSMPQIIFKEVQPFIMASHLLWGLFGLFQSVNSNIDFDFFSYGMKRLLALFDC